MNFQQRGQKGKRIPSQRAGAAAGNRTGKVGLFTGREVPGIGPLSRVEKRAEGSTLLL